MVDRRQQLDASFPTIVRYVGLALAVVLVLAPVVAGVPIASVAGGYPLATGMIFYKTIRDATHDGRDE